MAISINVSKMTEPIGTLVFNSCEQQMDFNNRQRPAVDQETGKNIWRVHASLAQQGQANLENINVRVLSMGDPCVGFTMLDKIGFENLRVETGTNYQGNLYVTWSADGIYKEGQRPVNNGPTPSSTPKKD